MNRILIAEDEPHLRELICDYFRSKGDCPIEAADGAEALARAADASPDAILLDILMPGVDGWRVCERLRRTSNVPILFLTALADEDDKLRGYALGADDYITKPFAMAVLYAKVGALIRRCRGSMRTGGQFAAGALVLDLIRHQVFADGVEVALTPREFALLHCLMLNKNQVLSREQLLNQCWGYDYDGDIRAVDTYVKRLREKLGSAGRCIRTIVKVGYCLED